MTLLEHIVIPVATKADAEETCASLQPHLDDISNVLVVHVIEKAGGGIDKAPLSKREDDAAEILSHVETLLGDTVSVETETAYGTDIVETLFTISEDTNATALVFVSRGGNRIVQLLSGDTSVRLITEGSIPVVALPGER